MQQMHKCLIRQVVTVSTGTFQSLMHSLYDCVEDCLDIFSKPLHVAYKPLFTSITQLFNKVICCRDYSIVGSRNAMSSQTEDDYIK